VKYTQLAKSVPICFACGRARDGTIVLAHRNRSGFGLKFGRGIKSLSICGAFICFDCHQYGDGDGRKDYDWWELASARSLTWAWERGFIRFKAGGGDSDKALR